MVDEEEEVEEVTAGDEVEVGLCGSVVRGVERGVVDRGKEEEEEEEEEEEGKKEEDVGTDATRNPRHLTADANILSLSCDTSNSEDEGER